MRTNGASLSYWMTTTSDMPSFERLLGNMETEVCVIGGGIAGLTTAYLLSRQGKRVVLIEAFELLGGGETSIVHAEKIDCGFGRLPGYLYGLPGQDSSILAREMEADARAGVAVARLPRAPDVPFDTGHAYARLEAQNS